MFAPPARSRHMNGIMPAPARSTQPAACAFAVDARSSESSVGAMTMPTPEMNPWARKSRRVTGRL